MPKMTALPAPTIERTDLAAGWTSRLPPRSPAMRSAGDPRGLPGQGEDAGINVRVRTRGSHTDQGKSLWIFIWAKSCRSSAVAPNGAVTLKIIPGCFLINARTSARPCTIAEYFIECLPSSGS